LNPVLSANVTVLPFTNVERSLAQLVSNGINTPTVDVACFYPSGVIQEAVNDKSCISTATETAALFLTIVECIKLVAVQSKRRSVSSRKNLTSVFDISGISHSSNILKSVYLFNIFPSAENQRLFFVFFKKTENLIYILLIIPTSKRCVVH
jgi:hypothetical protein